MLTLPKKKDVSQNRTLFRCRLLYCAGVRLTIIAVVLLSACKQLPTFSGPLDPRLDGAVRRTCEQTVLSFFIRGSNPGAEVSNNQVVVPKVTLIGPTQVETDAIWDDAEKAVLVSVAGLAAGTYAVRIDRFSDHEVREIPAAIVVKRRPVVSQTRFNALCTTGSGKDVVLVGQNLADTEVTLVEGGLVLPAVANFDGSELTVTLASNVGAVGGKVNLRVASAPDCATETTDERSVDVTGPPEVESFEAGPTLATLDANEAPKRTQQIALEDEVHVRISGTNLVSGTAVSALSADGTAVLASRVEVDGDFLDAYFAKNSLSPGLKTVRVDVGGCSVDSAGALDVVSIGSALAIKRMWQDSLSYNTDVASGEALTLEMQTAPAASTATSTPSARVIRRRFLIRQMLQRTGDAVPRWAALASPRSRENLSRCLAECNAQPSGARAGPGAARR